MSLHQQIQKTTKLITKRSQKTREAYLKRIQEYKQQGIQRAHLSCGNRAHTFASSNDADKVALSSGKQPHLGIITAYNDMLSAHKPYEDYPKIIRQIAREQGCTAQVAGGVPSMCDGITQGQVGMELSLFSREVIALSASVALSHNVFDTSVYLGVCDKIVPGLIIAAASFGHLPALFVPSGPMPSGISNDKKVEARKQFAQGLIGEDELLKYEMQSYHSEGTCTFYGTANTNQMLMETMGLHLPGSSFINPSTPLREAFTKYAITRALQITALNSDYTPISAIMNEKNFVNALVVLNATGGSTNLVMHLCAMARAFGIVLELQDFADISSVTPLLAKVYPNGKADINAFREAGDLRFVLAELLQAGLLHEDITTVIGKGLEQYTKEPVLGKDGILSWKPIDPNKYDDNVLRKSINPFDPNGGIKRLSGNIGEAIMKVSAIKKEDFVLQAKVRVFDTQEQVQQAFRAKELFCDCIIVLRYQGPKANGMPELHGLNSILGVVKDKGYKIAFLTDGRMSGASGKIPSLIHLTPEAKDKGAIAYLQDGDEIRIDANKGEVTILDDIENREIKLPDLSMNEHGMGRELFAIFRDSVGSASSGASAIINKGK